MTNKQLDEKFPKEPRLHISMSGAEIYDEVLDRDLTEDFVDKRISDLLAFLPKPANGDVRAVSYSINWIQVD